VIDGQRYGAAVANYQTRHRRQYPWDYLPAGVLLAAGLFAIATLGFVAAAVINMTDSEVNLARVFYLPVGAAVTAWTSWGLFAHQRVAWILGMVVGVVGSIALFGALGWIPAVIVVGALLIPSSWAWFSAG
jgi:hypothetical protein